MNESPHESETADEVAARRGTTTMVTTKDVDGTEQDTDVIDHVFENTTNEMYPVPANLEALAHEQRSEQQENAAPSLVDPVSGTTLEVAKNDAAVVQEEEDVLDKFCSPFEHCCGANTTHTSTVQPSNMNGQTDEDEDLEKGTVENVPFESEVQTIKNDDDQSSLAEIAARMNEIDLETATVDTAPQGQEVAGLKVVTKSKKIAWYREPVYAALIVACGLFSIAIVVMAILLIVSN